MSFYLLDTNICIFLLNQRRGFERIVQRMDGLERREVGLSAITVAELEFGIAASKSLMACYARPCKPRERQYVFWISSLPPMHSL
jgi:predicted nucleic acid-binding protein